MRKLYKKVIFVLILFGVLSVVSNALALELEWPLSPIGTKLEDDSKFPQLVKYLYEWGISLGGLAAFISLVMAGFQYLTSAGDTGKMSEARNQINSAVLGLVLLLSSFLILETINPQLTIFQEHEFILAPPDYEVIEMKGLSDIQKSCEKVYIYADERCEGNIEMPAQIGSCTSDIVSTLGTLPNCIKAEVGNCNVIHLYTSNSCFPASTSKGTPISIIEGGSLSIKAYHADGAVRSIYIEGNPSLPVINNCNFDCSQCEYRGSCEESDALCIWDSVREECVNFGEPLE